MRRVEIVNEHFYHIYNRGVDKREIFLDIQDYYRFLHYLYECNNIANLANTRRKVKEHDRGRTSVMERDLLVDIISFCLMPNHFHLKLRQLKDGGISKFMQKILTGYTMYFNKKHQRTGRLFESKFKAVLIENEEYLLHLSRYIHLNPLDLIEPNWKEEGIKDWDRANEFLEEYKWSSYLDYIEKHNFPSVINKGPLSWYFKTKYDYKKYVQSWMAKDMDLVEELILE